MTFYLGIDGGGSKTTCAVGDEKNLLASVTAGPSNIVRIGEEIARESLHQGIRQVCAAAGITPEQISSTCAGAAGAATDEIKAVVRRFLTEIVPGPIEILGDMEIALEAAFGAASGVIVIAGTGSIAFGRNQQGTTARAGGWGFAISDEGSAHWIGRIAISAVLRAKDQQRPGDIFEKENISLQRGLLKLWDLTSLDDLVRMANATPAPNFAALCPVVQACADGGDELAQGVLTGAGTELARLASIVIRRLFEEKDSSPAVHSSIRVAMIGGIFRHASRVRQVFHHEIKKLHPQSELNSQVIDPVDGALRRARRAASQAAGR